MTLRILVTGSRTYTDERIVGVALRAAWFEFGQVDRPQDVMVVHGGARGADNLADLWAYRLGFRIERHPADWATHGRAAGPRRNAEMVASGADICLAFIKDESRGATNCAALAEKAGISTRRYLNEQGR